MLRPAGERVTSDPYAAAFVNPLMVQLTRLSIATGISAGLGLEGMINFALAREAHIEMAMRREIARGLGQVVILGAGFDTRVYRVPGLDGIGVFEVDHPITQAQKREALAHGKVEPPKGHRFVPVDFDINGLGERLMAAGYDPVLRTLFIWQGVIMYLTPAGIDATLAFIAQNAGTGSALVFDFMSRDWLRSRSNRPLRWVTGALGESMTFAIDESEIAPFLEQRGFISVETIESEALKRLYLAGRNANRQMADGVFIATARIA